MKRRYKYQCGNTIIIGTRDEICEKLIVPYNNLYQYIINHGAEFHRLEQYTLIKANGERVSAKSIKELSKKTYQATATIWRMVYTKKPNRLGDRVVYE